MPPSGQTGEHCEQHIYTDVVHKACVMLVGRYVEWHAYVFCRLRVAQWTPDGRRPHVYGPQLDTERHQTAA